MPFRYPQEERRLEMVKRISITIGDETVDHDFGRRVPMSYARKWAQHYLDVFTGQPSTFDKES